MNESKLQDTITKNEGRITVISKSHNNGVHNNQDGDGHPGCPSYRMALYNGDTQVMLFNVGISTTKNGDTTTN